MKTRSNSYSRQSKKTDAGSKKLKSTLNIILGFTCVVLGVAYLIQMNNLTVQGFALKELKTNASILAEENEDLHAKALNLQSYNALSPKLHNLNMVAVDDIIYLDSASSVVAKK